MQTEYIYFHNANTMEYILLFSNPQMIEFFSFIPETPEKELCAGMKFIDPY